MAMSSPFQHVYLSVADRSRDLHFFQRQCFHLGLRRSIFAFCPFYRRCHIAGCTICDLTLTHLRNGCELVRIASSDSARIRFYRAKCQSASCKDLVISIVHFLIALIQTFIISVEGISVFHNKFTTSHQSKARSCFISVLCLDLIKIHRKLTVGRNVVANDICKDFFVCWAQAKLSAISVL